jgi:hypothetical protein
MYAKRAEFGQLVHELAPGARETVVAIDGDGIESASLGVCRSTIERGTRLLAAINPPR